MAEAVTQSEVEDVLTSVRRLVGQGDDASAEASRSPQPVDEKLVLTPHQRVEGRAVLHLTPENAVGQPPKVRPAEASKETHSPAEITDNPLVLTQRLRVRSKSSSSDFSDLKAKIAALELAIARTSDQWEPDDTGSDAYAGTKPPAMHWEETAELDGQGKPLPTEAQASAPPQVERAPLQEPEYEEAVLDEDALRVLVADVVHAELQGPLGDRISRNVRKLVRQEIKRALAARSLY